MQTVVHTVALQYILIATVQGRPQDISRGGQIRGCGDESSPVGSRGGAPVGVWGAKPPEAGEKLWKYA